MASPSDAPSKRAQRPKITLQIPTQYTPRVQQTANSSYYGPPNFHGRAPATPSSNATNPYYNPFLNSKASEFVFKQFAGFKDFTMNTAKSGLSGGEKTAFWLFNKLSQWSKKWFTHIFLFLCLLVYSLIGGAMFMALELPNELQEKTEYENEIFEIRRNVSRNLHEMALDKEHLFRDEKEWLGDIEQVLQDYEGLYLKCREDHSVKANRTWTFYNAMFYSGTVYTTIVGVAGGMSEEENEIKPLTVLIPTIKTDGNTTTSGQIVISFPDKEDDENKMEESEAPQNLRKRRNLSKNRAQATRQREKTPEPGRMGVPHEDTTTSDEEEARSKNMSHSPQEAEAEDNYKEMMRLVQERAEAKDPDDLDIDEIKEARAFAANERRRRSISPFAVPSKEEIATLERKGSFVDPGNKLLSTTYTLSRKEEEKDRRDSLTSDTAPLGSSSLSPSTPTSGSPREAAVFPYPSSTKQQTELIYPDEKKQEPGRKVLTPVKKDDGDVFTFDEETKKTTKSPQKTLPQEQPTGGLVTKVIQVERSPSRKLTQENKPAVEVRPTTAAATTVERTPSKKSLTESKPLVVRRPSAKPATKDQQQQTQEPTKLPPVKPARSKSASRFGGKTSESEMSEDQLKLTRESAAIAAKRKNVATPRRFIKNKSPRAKRSQSVTRVEDLMDKTGTGMSQTSREIIQLLQQARARSLSIPNDDDRIPVEYKSDKRRTLATPNKSPASSRRTRGISCPKTIQIISQKEVLAGLSKVQKLDLEFEKNRTSRYIDASQSEYTSSCYSTSPSENEYEFNLVSKTAELNKKLTQLSQELEKRDKHLHNGEAQLDPSKSVLRKRSSANVKKDPKKEKPKVSEARKPSHQEKRLVKEKEVPVSKYRILNLRREWRSFKIEHKKDYDSIKLLNNKCFCDLIILIIFCGIGGMVFKNLEGSFENAYKCGTRNVKRDFIENLWKGSHYLREDDWKAMARNKLHEFEDQLHTAHEAGMTSHSGLRSWNFMNSFVYCLTIVTTIGYGHIVPSTLPGRVATIFYAIIGIPLFLIVLADFGKLFTRIIKFFWAFIRRLYYTGSCRKVRKTAPMQEMMKGFNMMYDVVRRPSQMLFEEDLNAVRRPSQLEGRDEIAIAVPNREDTTQSPPPLPPKPGQQPTWTIGGPDIEMGTPPETPAPSVFEIDDEFNLPISVAIVILIGYIFVGATLYMTWEEWTFFESFYFVFISMSTIGFGDFVPRHPMFMMASILYLVFGLALTSMCINVVQVKLSDTFKHASAKLGATIGLRVAEEDGALVPMTPALGDVAPVHRPLKEKLEVTETGLKGDDDVDPEISRAMS